MPRKKKEDKTVAAELKPQPQIAYSLGLNSLTVMSDGDVHMIDDTDPRFCRIRDLLQEKPPRVDEALKMMDIKTTVLEQAAGRVAISNTGVTFEGQPVGGYMTERLVQMAGMGISVEPWMMFMDNLMENPNADTREDLFKWMEAGKMPITEDGCIVGFKKVRDNYTDVHTGRFSNKVGSVLEMPREQCDPSRHNTCSTGFHFCSASYLSSFSGQRVMVVKIDPRDVTAIPSDYNNAKARCCRYEVTGELSSQAAAKHKVFDEPVMPVDPQEIPDLMKQETTPKKKTPTRAGPKSTIGQKGGTRKVASNASVVKRRGAPAPAAPATTARKAASKTTAKKTTTRKTSPSKVTKAVSKATKRVSKAASSIATGLGEALADVKSVVAGETPKAKRTKVKVTKAPAKTTTGRTKAASPAKSNAPKKTKAPAKKAPVAGKSKATGRNVLKPATKKSSPSKAKRTTKK